MIRWLAILCAAAMAAFAILPQSASAHEVRPAYLSAQETAPDEWRITWKQPVLEGKRLRIAPQFAGVSSPDSEPVPCEWTVETRENLSATTI
ncbi:MAG: hypothetical protein ACSHXH_19180, partial [Marivita sp.]